MLQVGRDVAIGEVHVDILGMAIASRGMRLRIVAAPPAPIELLNGLTPCHDRGWWSAFGDSQAAHVGVDEIKLGDGHVARGLGIGTSVVIDVAGCP